MAHQGKLPEIEMPAETNPAVKPISRDRRLLLVGALGLSILGVVGWLLWTELTGNYVAGAYIFGIAVAALPALVLANHNSLVCCATWWVWSYVYILALANCAT